MKALTRRRTADRIHACALEKHQKFFLEGPLLVMFLLIVDIGDHLFPI